MKKAAPGGAAMDLCGNREPSQIPARNQAWRRAMATARVMPLASTMSEKRILSRAWRNHIFEALECEL